MRGLRKGLTAVAIGVALLGAAVVVAGPGPAGAKMKARAFRAALANAGLSDAQKAKIKANFEAAKPNLVALRDQAKANREALKAALNAPTPDPTAIGHAMLKVKATREAMRAERQRLHDTTLAVLTPEQKAKFDGYLAALKDLYRLRGGGQHGPGNAPGGPGRD